MKLIIARHGYSESNASGCYTGYMDAPLSEVGHAQAALLADCLCADPDLHIDAVFSSDLSRAADTAAPTAKRLGLPVNKLSALRELDVGLWTGLPYAEVGRRYAADYLRFKQSIDAPCTGGESLHEACTRILHAVEEIAAGHANKTVLICSHALTSRLFCALAQGGSIEGVLSTKAPANASFDIYVYEGGRVTAIKTNCTEHLKALTPTVLPELL